MTKLRIVIGELELDASGTEEEVRTELRNFLKTIETAIAPRQETDSEKDRPND